MKKDKNNKLQFKKSVDWDNINNTNIPRPNKKDRNEKILIQRERAKIELIKKYNMTEIEAEMTLQNIERKAREKRNYEFNSKNIQKENINTKIKKQTIQEFSEDLSNEDTIIIPEHVKIRERKNTNQKLRKKQINALDEKNQETFHYNEIKENDKLKETSTEKKNHRNIDEIISNIIPDYEKHLSIEVNDVSLTFEIEKDKIDNLKEYIIRTIKRNKKEKFKIEALKNISFKIYKGEKIGIIGYNGAGKSTLLNVITGIYYPDTGCVKTYGKISPMLSLGAGFDHNYTGRENIFLNGAVLGYDKNFLKSKVDEIIEFSELGEYIDIPIKNYSSGMLAKLGFSIATIVEPDILIIDEVLGVGDVTFQKKSSDKIKSLMDGKTTVLLVSHSIGQIRELCDKAIWIDKGELREIGEVNEVCDHYLKDAEKATKEQLKNIQLK